MYTDQEIVLHCVACGGTIGDNPEDYDEDIPLGFHRSCWLGWPSELKREYLV